MNQPGFILLWFLVAILRRNQSLNWRYGMAGWPFSCVHRPGLCSWKCPLHPGLFVISTHCHLAEFRRKPSSVW